MRTFLLVFGILFLSIDAMDAQNAACDGSRYRQSVFSTVKKTTVNYASAPNHEDLPPIFGDSVVLQMDIYEPEGDAAVARPVVVLAHGGSFIFGDKSSMKDDCERFARAGYVAASIQYRLYPALVLGFPDSTAIFGAVTKAVSDMKAAVRFFREDAAGGNLFRADTTAIFVGGYSAGAVTALHHAYMDEGDDLPPSIANALAINGGLEGNSGSALNRTFSSRVSGVYNRSGGLYRREWLEAGDVPLVSIHGTSDNTVYFETGLAAGIAYLEGSGLIHPRADEVGLTHYLETVVGGDHTGMYTNTQNAAQYANFQQKCFDYFEAVVCATSNLLEPATGMETVQVFPNPVTSSFSVMLEEQVGPARLELWNQQGQLLHVVNQYQSGQPVQVGRFPAGTYQLYLITARGTAIKQVSIQR
jgi:dienelactone hydrolase